MNNIEFKPGEKDGSGPSSRGDKRTATPGILSVFKSIELKMSANI